MNFRQVPLLLAAALPFTGCSSDSADAPAGDAGESRSDTPVLPDTPYEYANQPLPAHFSVETEGFHGQEPLTDSDNTPADNPITNAGATLGRVLFYDRNLSSNRTVSCGSCHIAENGFSDPRVLSKGFEDGDTGRHSMGLTNARFYGEGRFFWDQRADTLEDQVLMPFQDQVEMGMTLETLQARADEASYYPDLFTAAFGDATITTERMSLALAQFVRSMVSTNSKYDEGRGLANKRSSDFANFSAAENLGKSLFSNPPPLGGFGCFACHQGEGFIAQKAQSNGLDLSTEEDPGYGEVTELAGDMGRFKVPSLRNVAVRAPYMHDGRFATLEEVVEHYSTGLQQSPNIEPPLGARQNFTQEEKDALVAFLKTLTDEAMLQDPKFSDPFVVQ